MDWWPSVGKTILFWMREVHPKGGYPWLSQNLMIDIIDIIDIDWSYDHNFSGFKWPIYCWWIPLFQIPPAHLKDLGWSTDQLNWWALAGSEAPSTSTKHSKKHYQHEKSWKNAYELHLMQNDATCILDYFGVIYIIILCELYVRGFFLKPVPRRIQPRNEKPGLMRRISYHSIEFRTVSSSLVLGYE